MTQSTLLPDISFLLIPCEIKGSVRILECRPFIPTLFSLSPYIHPLSEFWPLTCVLVNAVLIADPLKVARLEEYLSKSSISFLEQNMVILTPDSISVQFGYKISIPADQRQGVDIISDDDHRDAWRLLFSLFNFISAVSLSEALSQGDGVDLDALMADLCSMEQDLSSISKEPSRKDSVVKKSHKEVVPGKMHSKETKSVQKQSINQTTLKQGGLKGSAARSPKSLHSNFSLDDITAQLEQASLSMDEAARQTSTMTHDIKPTVTIQHRRTGSAGTVSDADIRSTSTSSRSSITSATSSQDSLDTDKVTRPQDLDLNQQGQPTTEVLMR